VSRKATSAALKSTEHGAGKGEKGRGKRKLACSACHANEKKSMEGKARLLLTDGPGGWDPRHTHTEERNKKKIKVAVGKLTEHPMLRGSILSERIRNKREREKPRSNQTKGLGVQ